MRTDILLFHPDDDPGGASDDAGGTGEDPGDLTPTPPAGDPEAQVAKDKELASARREAAKYRKELRDTQARLEKLEEGQKTESEKLSDRNSRLSEENGTLKETNRVLRVSILAGKVGIVPDAQADAAKLLDWESVKDPDSDASIEVALRELVKDRPFLLGNVAGGADGGAGGDRTSTGDDMNRQIREAAGYST